MRRSKEDVLAAAAGLTPYANFRWPSDVGGELGVPVVLVASSHPDVRVLWCVGGLGLIGFGLLALDVTAWVIAVALAGSAVLVIRSTIRLRVGVSRERRLQAEVEEQRRALG